MNSSNEEIPLSFVSTTDNATAAATTVATTADSSTTPATNPLMISDSSAMIAPMTAFEVDAYGADGSNDATVSFKTPALAARRTASSRRAENGNLGVSAFRPVASVTIKSVVASDVSDDQMFGSQELRNDREENVFYFGRFVFEFFTQWLYPVTLPIVLAAQGLQAVLNKQFLPDCKNGGLVHVVWWIYGSLVQLAGWYCFALTLVIRADWAVPIAVVTTAFFTFRGLVIAGKYACLTEAFYAHFCESPFNVTDVNLVTSWMSITEKTVERELRLAQRRTTINLSQFDLVFKDGTAMSASDYILRLVKRVWGKTPSKLYDLAARVPGIAIALFGVWVYFETFGLRIPSTVTDYLNISLVVASIASLHMNAPACFYFAIISFLHAQRHFAVQDALLRAVIRTRASAPTDRFMIYLHWEDNLATFCRLRIVARNFGAVYGRRLSFNTFATAATIAMLLLYLLQQALAQARDWRILAVVAIFVVFCGGFAVSNIALGVQINRLETMTMDLLASERLLMQEDADFSSDVAMHAHFIAAAKSIELRLAVEPFPVMFLPARPELLTGFIGALISGILILLQIAVRGSIL